jgi:hypothetical protein
MPLASSNESVPARPGTSPPATPPASSRRPASRIEAADDQGQQTDDRLLEAAVPAGLQREDRERRDRGDEPGGQQRHAEEQVERDRRPDELREVGGHSDQLGLHPQAPGHRPRQMLAAQLGEVAARGDAELRRQVLDQHRHEVRGDDDPQQQVAVPGAARDVRREVAGVDVGDRGHERGPEQHKPAAQRGAGGERCGRRRRGRTGARFASCAEPHGAGAQSSSSYATAVAVT